MVTPRKSPLGKKHPAAHQNFAPTFISAPRRDIHTATYTSAVEKSRAILTAAKEKGIHTTDILVALVGLGYSPKQAVEEIEQIHLLQKHMPTKARLMAEERVRSGWYDAQKAVLRAGYSSRPKRT